MLTAEFQIHEPWPILVVQWIDGGGSNDDDDDHYPMIDCLIMCATSTGKSWWKIHGIAAF